MYRHLHELTILVLMPPQSRHGAADTGTGYAVTLISEQGSFPSMQQQIMVEEPYSMLQRSTVMDRSQGNAISTFSRLHVSFILNRHFEDVVRTGHLASH